MSSDVKELLSAREAGLAAAKNNQNHNNKRTADAGEDGGDVKELLAARDTAAAAAKNNNQNHNNKRSAEAE